MQHLRRKPLQSRFDEQRPAARLGAALLAVLALGAGAAQAQTFPVTPGQRSTAEQVAQAGVPLSELAENAPGEYTVKRGDTLWGISGLFLKSPWRWPELWGMNMQEIRNPHLIYPGQQLVLEKADGKARLRLRGAGDLAQGDIPMETVRVSPRVRVEPLADSALPTLRTHLIEPFLAEPVIVGADTLQSAPRIVAAPEDRVMLTRGDRAYARGLSTSPLKQAVPGRSETFRVFRNAKPLRDPATDAILGYEAQYLGKAQLVRSEGVQTAEAPTSRFSMPGFGTSGDAVIPATIDIVVAKEEMRIGDRLLPEPPRQFTSYVPHAPSGAVTGAIVSVYGDAVSIAGQNQVVVINKGTADGIESGHVLAILKSGVRMVDRSQAGETRTMQLPDERNGLLMVFRPFEKLSYALILEINDSVKVGDRIANPR